MSEEQKSKSGCSWLHVMVLAFSALLIALMFPPCLAGIQDKAGQAATAGNCRQIVAALRLYAVEHDGNYPDSHPSSPKSANQAFRVLIRNHVLEDERVFGAMGTRFIPDNNIGEAPDYPEAFERGENHWAMTKGAAVNSPPRMPLAFENPATATWPPTWNIDAARMRTKGRAWSGGRIIVGFKDESVELIKLESSKGTNVGPARDHDSKDVFTRTVPSMQVLDVEE